MVLDSEESFWVYSPKTVGIVTAANLLPLVGLVGFGWGVTEILVVYWVEAVIAVLVGLVKTFPARLVGFPKPDPRSRPSIRTRPGTVDVGNGRVTGYVRNIPYIGGQPILLLFLIIPMGALVIADSPLYYSARGTAESVAVAAGLLAGTHLLTAHVYFEEKRYDRTVPELSDRSGFAIGVGVTTLVAVLLAVDVYVAQPALEVWPPVLSYGLVGGKIGLDILFRCRDRDLLEPLEDGVDPFEFQADTVEALLLRTPGMKAAELPRVDRPARRPHTTVRPNRWRLLRASPVLGLLVSGHPALLVLLGLGIYFVAAGFSLVLPLLIFCTVAVFAVGPVVASVLPRHATLAYEFYDDQLVCYDRWLDEPVWNLPYADVTGVSVERGLDARIGGYGTVVVETADDRTARLSYLRDYRAIADRLKRVVDDGRPPAWRTKGARTDGSR